MKKLMIIAVFTATGIVFVSCDKESLESNIPQTNKLEKVEIQNAFARKGDSILLQTTTTDPGPGDDVVIITPPKP